MFWMRNEENNFPIRTLILRPEPMLGLLFLRNTDCQYSPFITLYLVSIGIESVLKGQFYRGIIGK